MSTTLLEATTRARRRVGWHPGLARLVRRLGRTVLVVLPYAWLLAFFLVPFVIVLKLSFSVPILAQPPYEALWHLTGDIDTAALEIKLNLASYLLILTDPDNLYVRAYLNSARISAVSTAITLTIGFPMAYGMARAPLRWRGALVMLVILPFWTSFLIRVYAWIGILKNEGLLNLTLMKLGLISSPLVIYNTETAVLIGIVYSYLPFMILPLYANLERHDTSLIEAAVDLGCHPIKAFWLVTVPLAMPGIIAGCLLVFIPAVGEFVIPDLLGGARTLMIGRTLWQEFFENHDWPMASAVAVLLLLILVVPIVFFERQRSNAKVAP